MATLSLNGAQYDFESRLLAHLKVVITQKMRRRESFTLSWSRTAAEGSGRSSLWMSDASQLHFRFAGARPPELNGTWLEALVAGANRAQGLNLDDVRETPEGHGAGATATSPQGRSN